MALVSVYKMFTDWPVQEQDGKSTMHQESLCKDRDGQKNPSAGDR